MKAKRRAVPGLSPESQDVWDWLDEETKKNIQKTNPFRAERDKAIVNLIKGKGLRIEIVQELSGLYRSTIYRILNQRDYLPQYARKDIRNLVRSFQAFINALTAVLDDNYRRGRR